MIPEPERWGSMLNRLDAEVRRTLRSAYDVRVILGDLAEKTRTVADRQELASLMRESQESI